MSVSQTNSNSAAGGGGVNLDIAEFVRAKHRIDETVIGAWQRMIRDKMVENINVQYRGMTALMYQSADGTIENMTWLLDKSADPNIQDENGWSPLHHAAYNSFLDVLEILLEKGADITKENSRGHTALYMAQEISTEKDREKVIAVLKEHGATE